MHQSRWISLVKGAPCCMGDCGSLPAMTTRGVSIVLRGWERRRSPGLGARATADMAGKCPLCALGPMMSALILSSFLIKEKGQ